MRFGIARLFTIFTKTKSVVHGDMLHVENVVKCIAKPCDTQDTILLW